MIALSSFRDVSDFLRHPKRFFFVYFRRLQMHFRVIVFPGAANRKMTASNHSTEFQNRQARALRGSFRPLAETFLNINPCTVTYGHDVRTFPSETNAQAPGTLRGDSFVNFRQN